MWHSNLCYFLFPDEKHNLLMVRLSRTRLEDSVWHNSDLKPNRRYARRDEPCLQKDTAGCEFAESAGLDGDDDDVSFCISVEDLTDCLPTFDQRRRILATDALASVEGSRVMVELTMQYLFGVNYCRMCPNCATHGNPCQDLFLEAARNLRAGFLVASMLFLFQSKRRSPPEVCTLTAKCSYGVCTNTHFCGR